MQHVKITDHFVQILKITLQKYVICSSFGFQSSVLLSSFSFSIQSSYTESRYVPSSKTKQELTGEKGGKVEEGETVKEVEKVTVEKVEEVEKVTVEKVEEVEEVGC